MVLIPFVIVLQVRTYTLDQLPSCPQLSKYKSSACLLSHQLLLTTMSHTSQPQTSKSYFAAKAISSPSSAETDKSQLRLPVANIVKRKSPDHRKRAS